MSDSSSANPPRRRAEVEGLRIILTEGLPEWVGCVEPANLSELAKYLAERLEGYRTFPEKVDNYWRNVPVSNSPSIAYTRREKNPRMVGARLGLAKTLLHNVYHWLDRRAVPDRPPPEEPANDEDAAYRQLSRLLIWLENAARQASSDRSKPEQAEGTGAGSDPAEGEQAEGGGKVNPDVRSAENLTDRQCLILETMLEHEITSERRRKTRKSIVRLINRTHNAQSYGRDFATLAKRGLVKTREGSDGGTWLTSQGKAKAQELRSSN